MSCCKPLSSYFMKTKLDKGLFYYKSARRGICVSALAHPCELSNYLYSKVNQHTTAKIFLPALDDWCIFE